MFQVAFDKALPDTLNGGSPDMQRLGNGAIRGAFMRLQQDMRPIEPPGRHRPFADQVQQLLPFIVAQVDDVDLLGHCRLLTFFHSITPVAQSIKFSVVRY
jgi:hypothetical protein